MTRWLAAALRAERSGTKLTKPTKPSISEVVSVKSVLSGGGEPREQVTSTPHRDQVSTSVTPSTRGLPPGQYPHGFALGMQDAPRTWTGRVVSLDEWCRLSDWDRHGPDGRVWCGLCRHWHQAGNCGAVT